MRLEIGFLRSQVGRRILAMFVLAALIPIATTAVLSFYHVTQLFSETSQARLHDECKTYGLKLFERLVWAENKLAKVSAGLNSGRFEKSAVENIATPQFNALTLIYPSNDAVPLFGEALTVPELTLAELPRLKAGEAILFHKKTSNGPQILMTGSLDPKRLSSAVLVARLHPNFLWGDSDTFAFDIDFYIFDSHHNFIFSTRKNLPNTLFKALNDGKLNARSGQFTWKQVEGRHLAAYWELFLDGRFHAKSWTVVASQIEDLAYAPIAAFKRIYPPLALLSIVVVMLLSITQIRRILIPLEKLTAATRNIANKDFTKSVPIASGDEFETLAHSFNFMANRLGEQFSTLTMLSDVDQLILSTLEAEPVIIMVINNITRVAPCDIVAVTVMENEAPQMARIYIKDTSTEADPFLERVPLISEEIQELIANERGIFINNAHPTQQYLNPCVQLGATSFIVFPILHNNSLLGIISLGYQTSLMLAKEDLPRVKDLADRLAVALAAAERESRLYNQANYDSLTGLPNRQLFKDRLSQELAHANRERYGLGLLFIDLDHFKNINDTQGHSAGDQLLQQAAQRLTSCVRETDTVARLGGDEFTVILSKIADPKDVNFIARQIQERFSIPMNIDNREHFVSASIGITIYPDDGSNTEELLMNADTAMYQAKKCGRGSHVFFQDEMNRDAKERVSLERDLRRALERDEFFLTYQPQLELSTQRVFAVEALLRWQHPQRGLVPPAQFIPLIEDTGLIHAIGQWVLREACTQFMRWQSDLTPLRRIAINVSVQQFRQSSFVDSVAQLIDELDMPPDCLELEITESLLANDVDNVIVMLDELRALGVQLSVDDFGTGYSSLNYLTRFPINTLKIDRSFIRETNHNHDAVTVISTIIAMANTLRKNTIAEGVETRQQLALLTHLNCDYVQGHYFSPPLTAEDLVEFLQTDLNNLDPRLLASRAPA